MDDKSTLIVVFSSALYVVTGKLFLTIADYGIVSVIALTLTPVLIFLVAYLLLFKKIKHTSLLCEFCSLCLTLGGLCYVPMSTAFMLKSTEPVLSVVLNSCRKQSCRPCSIIPLLTMVAGIYIFGVTWSTMGFNVLLLSNIVEFVQRYLIKTSSIVTNVRLRQAVVCVLCMLMLMVTIWLSQNIGFIEQKTCVVLFICIVNVVVAICVYFSKQHVSHSTNARNTITECSVLMIILLLLIEGTQFNVWNWLGLSILVAGSCIQSRFETPKESLPTVPKEPEQTGFQITKYIILLTLILVSLNTPSIISSPSFEHSQANIDSRSAYSLNIAAQQVQTGAPFDDLVNQFGFSYKSIVSNPAEESKVQALTDTKSVINEIQRIHFNLFSELLKPYKYVILLDISHTESKGDPAITVGEVLLIQRLGKKLIHYCSEACCTDPNLVVASQISQLYSKDELVIMIQGGGNLVGWETHDILRSRAFKHFKGFQFIMFPQTLFIQSTPEHLEFCHQLYRNQDNLTMLFRDQISFERGKEHFNGKARLMLAPDMAFQIGPKKRIMDPTYDIVWLKREDKESPGYEIPVKEIPPEISYATDDWAMWSTQIDDYRPLSNAFMFVNSGFTFLQRGRVVITDRLHGHIFSVLMDIPHVLIGNQYKKIDGFHETWTKGLQNVRMASNASHALSLALELLNIYDGVLPPKFPFMDIKQPCMTE